MKCNQARRRASHAKILERDSIQRAVHIEGLEREVIVAFLQASVTVVHVTLYWREKQGPGYGDTCCAGLAGSLDTHEAGGGFHGRQNKQVMDLPHRFLP